MQNQLKQWLANAPSRLLGCLSYAMIAVATLIIVGGLVIFLTGNAGSLNRALGEIDIFGSPTYSPEVDPTVMANMMRTFYPGVVPFAIIMATVLVGLVVVVALSLLARLGRWVANVIASMMDKPVNQILYLATFIMWGLAILVSWLVLNTNQTIYILFGQCGLMLVGLGLDFAYLWLVGRKPSKSTPSPEREANSAKDNDR